MLFFLSANTENKMDEQHVHLIRTKKEKNGIDFSLTLNVINLIQRDFSHFHTEITSPVSSPQTLQ